MESQIDSKKGYIYIHIPFCIRKCNYCNFISFEKGQYSTEQYITAIQKELKETIALNGIETIKTIYIGGGTPNTLNISNLTEILKPLNSIKKEDNFEFSMEINPGLSDIAYFNQLKIPGVNRISIGVQSLNDKMLENLGRIHRAYDVYKTVSALKMSGFDNISIDLMYGLPGQSVKDWKSTLIKALDLDVQHISAYGLKIEENTPFSKIYTQEHPDVIEDETAAEMFLLTDEILTANNYEHYEISNYARTGNKCIHNLNYWNNGQYTGCGVAAHSHINNKRCANTEDFELYINNYLNSQQCTILSDNDIIEEYIILKLRLSEGINFTDFEREFGFNFMLKYKLVIEKFRRYFIITDNSIRLKLTGMLLSNIILAEFLDR